MNKTDLAKVVITTYDVVASEWIAPPKVKKGKENVKAGKSDDEGSGSDSDDSLINKVKSKSKEKTLGPLFDAKFHRIILGEGCSYNVLIWMADSVSNRRSSYHQRPKYEQSQSLLRAARSVSMVVDLSCLTISIYA